MATKKLNRKRKPPSREQLAEAAALKRLFDERANLSQEKFAEQQGLGTQGNIWQYLHGYMPLNLEAAIKFAEGLQVEIAEFSPRLAELLSRGRRSDERLTRYDIPDHELHALLQDVQQLGRAKRQELLRWVHAAVLGDRELAKPRDVTDCPVSDAEIEKA